MNLYPYFKQVALDSGHADNVDLNTDDIRVILLEGYDYSAAHQFLDDVLAEAGTTELARSTALQSPTVVDGTFDAANITIAAVAGGDTITDVVVFKHTGTDSTAVVVAHIDQNQAAAALSLATNGSDVDVQFHASGIFDL